MDQYDEFGNYIGSDSDDSDLDDRALPADAADEGRPTEADDDDIPTGGEAGGADGSVGGGAGGGMDVDDAGPSNQIVLHENKRYYASTADTYGDGVEALVHEEDTQLLTEPIVAPIKVRKYNVVEKDLPVTRFDKGFMLDMMHHPDMVRNVVFAGHLHHGKTSLVDMLVFETHQMTWNADQPERYTDTHVLSRSRGVSIKSSPMSLVLQTTRGKSHLVNLLDTPGHVNFADEVAAAGRLADGMVLVVDVVEGVMGHTEDLIRYAVAEGLALVLVLNKMDRLILELRLPPAEAYYKIKHTIDEVNTVLASVDPSPDRRLSPERGNVAFASSQMGWCFTTASFADLYGQTFGPLDTAAFADRLWGNIYYDEETRKFSKTSKGIDHPRSFVHFVLEPLYKLYTQVLSEDSASLAQTLAELGIHLKPAAFKMDVKPLLKAVLDQFFGPATGLVDMLVDHVPSPKANAAAKISQTYSGPLNTELAQSMVDLDPSAPVVLHVSKLYHTADAQEFRAFARVMAGTVRLGQAVRVLGEGYSPDDEEDAADAVVDGLWVSQSRYFVECAEAPAGSLVLIGGIDRSITKTATVVARHGIDDELYVFSPVKHLTQSVLKIAVEPIAPSELPKMLDGLRKVSKSYPLLTTKVEESGEHVVLGTGELYLDSVMHDLRRLFAEIEIKVSDPVVQFRETVIETSALKVYAETPNKKNKLTVIAEPLESGIADDIETGRVSMRSTAKERGKHFVERYQWDLLASRSIWAFGPDDNGPNVLMDDTLPSEVDKRLMLSVKESIKQGFQWGAREGPLCDEPMRNVKFRILDATIAPEAILRGSGQVIPTARRVCYSSFLMASPRLMEPMFAVEVQAPADCVAAVFTVLARRRGHVTKDVPKAGSPLYTVKALIPVLDSAGFETDLRTATQGQAFCTQTFDHWAIVPGDPTDTSIVLRPLEPASGQSLARDLVLKSRRRKGLSDSIGVSKYLEEDTLLAISAAGMGDLLG